MSTIRDLFTPIKLINTGVIITSNGSNLSINQSSGNLWGYGIGWFTDQLNPNMVLIPSNIKRFNIEHKRVVHFQTLLLIIYIMMLVVSELLPW
jgi:hypothetical protein